jgi:hypothetical protein
MRTAGPALRLRDRDALLDVSEFDTVDFLGIKDL